MVGQQLPQTNKKYYSVLQYLMQPFYHRFTDLNTAVEEEPYVAFRTHPGNGQRADQWFPED